MFRFIRKTLVKRADAIADVFSRTIASIIVIALVFATLIGMANILCLFGNSNFQHNLVLSLACGLTAVLILYFNED